MPELELPLEMSSVGSARRWAESWLEDWSEDGLTAVTLVVSELVANVVLHARTGCRIDIEPEGGCCRISVADRDPRLPTVKHYGDDAPTGRGLRLVGQLSTEWGIERRPGGKAVWAIVYDRPWSQDRWTSDHMAAPAAPPASAGVPAEVTVATAGDPTGDRAIGVRLLGVPLQILVESQEHNDELMREFAFLAGSRHIYGRLDALAREVEDHFGPAADGITTEVERAAAGGRPTVDLHVELSRQGWLALESLSELLDEADAYCERAELLTLASSAPVRRLRHWYRDEVRRQMDGHEPSPWPDPGKAQPAARPSSS